MHRIAASPRARRARVLLVILVATIALAARASAGEGADTTVATSPGAVPPAWVGRFCPIGGCTGAPGSGLSNAAGFGAAVVLAGWWVQRRSRNRD